MEYSTSNGNSLNSSTIKIYAMIFMLIDHIGGLVIAKYLLTVTDLKAFEFWKQVNEVCRGIGRIAFPIFCYQLVVGFRYTHNQLKHVLYLLIFTLISEIPFDLAFSDMPFYPQYQSVYVTLLLGSFAIVLMDYIKEIPYAIIFKLMIGITFSCFAFLLKTDYGFAGVMMIIAFYLLLDNRYVMVYAVPLIFLCSYFGARIVKGNTVETALKATFSEAVSTFAMLLIIRDNGIRKGGKALKWFGYAFYPVHIFILYLVRRFIIKI